MPTVLDMLGQDVPDGIDGRSLYPAMKDPSIKGREFVVSTIPFANPGDRVRSVDNVQPDSHLRPRQHDHRRRVVIPVQRGAWHV